MKRIFLVIAQVVCYTVLYEILAFISLLIIAFLGRLVQSFSLFRLRIFFDSIQLISLTLIPMFVGVILCSILGLIFKKKFDIISFFITLAFYSFSFISNIIQNATAYGFLSNDFLSAIWSGLIIGATTFVLLFKMTGYNLKKEDDNILECEE